MIFCKKEAILTKKDTLQVVDYKKLRKILNSSSSVKHYSSGKTIVADSSSFRGLTLSALEEAQEMIASSVKEDTVSLATKCGIKEIDTLETITKRASRTIGSVLDCLSSPHSLSASDIHKKISIRDSILNNRWNVNTAADPTRSAVSLPNVYISPWEASSLYSQKGLFETIVNKKSKSILLNGCNLENKRLTQEQLDTVKEKMEVLNFKNMLAESTLTSLVYGGSLVFPFFKKDTPVTTTLPLSSLLKLGVLKKDCIDYFIQLDRWNTFIIPPFNPTQKDFLRPDFYTIPFLGSDVHHSRTARVVTAKQAGYWGQIINQGWGISDMGAYLQSGMNYKVAVQSIPLMIQQMSILARVVNVDGVLATEGSNALDALVEQETIRTREASPDNPVTMDVLGDIKSIDRNFGQVPELIRLLRQDVASDANLPEPLLWSSEKGNFASGDDTQGNLFKQNESVQMIHKELESQYKQLAKIVIIDALGTDKEIIEALPYTQLHFDQPVIANAVERSQIGKFFSENVFNLVASQTPLDIAFEMAAKNVSSDLAPTAEMLEKLAQIQQKVDEQNDERFKMEMETQKAAVENQVAATAAVGTEKKDENKTPTEKLKDDKQNKLNKEEKGYSRLEQKSKEKTRIGSTKRNEMKAKAESKKIK